MLVILPNWRYPSPDIGKNVMKAPKSNSKLALLLRLVSQMCCFQGEVRGGAGDRVAEGAELGGGLVLHELEFQHTMRRIQIWQTIELRDPCAASKHDRWKTARWRVA
jgi:hypothetical protein